MSVTTEISRLEALRAEIDRADDELLAVLDRRMRICREIAEHKLATNVPMMAQDRLDGVFTKAQAYAREHGLDVDFVNDVYDAVTLESCRIEGDIIGDTPTGGLAGRALRIDHVAIAVRDLEDAIKLFRDVYGFSVIERRAVQGEVSGMDSATMRVGNATFVLCQGDSPQSNVSRYIEHYGPGVQHIAISVRGQGDLLEDLRGRGADLLTGVINSPGLDQSFTKREPNAGTQLEFVTRTSNKGFSDDNVRELFAAMEREDVY
jgi:chorismate mutase-like protein